MTKEEFNSILDKHVTEIHDAMVVRYATCSIEGGDRPGKWDEGWMRYYMDIQVRTLQSEIEAAKESMEINHGG